ncbi:hypothetical protein G7Y89_g12250 [Cudoniella acicularis]|uniref:Peptidase S8/S53 domain-containing protein n=1 Tax=Cudoniella acicularis TaxID=354080 RepID=A0A8H4RBW6_9HELO|nr:hypothetical protein G7Y89_g12250 [Cudoniella acicularis]
MINTHFHETAQDTQHVTLHADHALLPDHIDQIKSNYNLVELKGTGSKDSTWTSKDSSTPMRFGMIQWTIQNDKHVGLVKRVLETLETEFKSSPFPRLETLRTLTSETTDSEDVLIKVVRPETDSERNELIESLKDLSNVMKDDTKDPPPEDTRIGSKSKPLMAPLLLSLFSTISKYWRCTCKPSHQAALLLYTNLEQWFQGQLDDGKRHASPFASSCRSRRFELQYRTQKLSVNLLEAAKVWIAEEESTVRSRVIQKSTNRLNLNVEGVSLSLQDKMGNEMKKNFDNCELVSFTEGFLENNTELQIGGKLCVAVILSYAFLDFCGETWFPRGWTKHSLYLMQRGKTLLLQPFLVTNMAARQADSKSTTTTAATRAQKLLHHGILLMEIFQQDLLNKTDGRVANLEETAEEIFKSIEWDVCERFGKAVEACIKRELIGNAMISSTPISESVTGSSQEISDEHFARVFCEKILAPLEADFESQWQDEDPDQVISTLNLPSIKQQKSPAQRGPKTNAAGSKHLHGHRHRPASRTSSPIPLGRSHQPPPTLTSLRKKPASLRFFDVVDLPDSTQVTGALRWFQNFDEDVIQSRLPKRAASKEKRIKIGVLDTGIDLKNAWISQRAGRIQCWLPGADCEDKDGHGTHFAHLLLRLAPHAHLRISKVSKTRLLKDADIRRIADAITDFSTGTGRVDVINLSFGFPNYRTQLNPILTAIRTARTNGVVIFAAAGNEGGNQGVFWPAAFHDGGHVIRINSSDGDGVPSGFNPDPEIGRRICTLGEGVPSCQPDPKDVLQMINRSGTSFATPISAAIASIVLGFMDNVDCSEYRNSKDLLPRLRTAVGMEKVLCEVCVRHAGSRRSGFSYITPWYFLAVEEKIRLPRILSILEGVPESPTPQVKP